MYGAQPCSRLPRVRPSLPVELVARKFEHDTVERWRAAHAYKMDARVKRSQFARVIALVIFLLLFSRTLAFSYLALSTVLAAAAFRDVP